MASGLFVVFMIVGIVVFGLIAYCSSLAAKRRREAMATVAAKRGWTYVERDDSWADRFRRNAVRNRARPARAQHPAR